MNRALLMMLSVSAILFVRTERADAQSIAPIEETVETLAKVVEASKRAEALVGPVEAALVYVGFWTPLKGPDLLRKLDTDDVLLKDAAEAIYAEPAARDMISDLGQQLDAGTLMEVSVEASLSEFESVTPIYSRHETVTFAGEQYVGTLHSRNSTGDFLIGEQMMTISNPALLPLNDSENRPMLAHNQVMLELDDVERTLHLYRELSSNSDYSGNVSQEICVDSNGHVSFNVSVDFGSFLTITSSGTASVQFFADSDGKGEPKLSIPFLK